MAGYGFRPYVINRSSPTPLMMFMVKTRAMPYGIAVTASHNPAIYNGIKVFTAGGRDADRTVTDKIEAEIAQLDAEEKALFMQDLGITESGLDRLIKESYSLLGLISFLTAGQPEVRAWTIRRGTKAPQAAGKIHSDIERGFIRAEVIAFDDLMAVGSMAAAKEKGLIRSEGKDYEMKDGDIVLFRFNV